MVAQQLPPLAPLQQFVGGVQEQPKPRLASNELKDMRARLARLKNA